MRHRAEQYSTPMFLGISSGGCRVNMGDYRNVSVGYLGDFRSGSWWL